jgi:hypothetical protein
MNLPRKPAARAAIFLERFRSQHGDIGTHFAGATAGHIVRDGNAYRLGV